MRKINSFVLDTNVLVSATILPASIPGKVLNVVLKKGFLLMSEEVFSEVEEVLAKPKFSRYFSKLSVELVIEQLRMAAVWEASPPPLVACRDPKDDKFLSLAYAGQASCLVSGDQDLLVLHPFQNIPILNPADFLQSFS